jgi:hypothetical protein
MTEIDEMPAANLQKASAANKSIILNISRECLR